MDQLGSDVITAALRTKTSPESEVRADSVKVLGRGSTSTKNPER
jgi:hypothetical protein